MTIGMHRMFVGVVVLLCVGEMRGYCQDSVGKAPSDGVVLQKPVPTSGAASQVMPAQVIQVGAKLVVVDAVVTDSSGNPVKGLKKEDFALSEGKTPQTVVNFEEHTGSNYEKADAAKVRSMLKLEPGVFTNYAPVSLASSVNVLLLDSLNTPVTDQMFMRQQLLKYLNSIRPGTQVAIFSLSKRLIMLQGFTTNPETLKRVIDHKEAQGSPLLGDLMSDYGPQESMSDLLADQQSESEISASLLYNVATFESGVQAMQDDRRAKDTLDAMNQLARYLAGIPGRKNLLWFSASFPINVLPDNSGLGDEYAGQISLEAEYRETSNLLGRGQVAVYPIDARGLMATSISATAVPTSQTVRSGGLLKSQAQYFATSTDENATMYRIADDSGGKAFLNTNDLAGAVESAIDRGSNYYTLTYIPSDTSSRDDFRTIHVKLGGAHSSDKLAYRHGYYADASDSPQAHAAVPSTSVLNAAELHGAPAATEIIFRARVAPVASRPDVLPPAINPNPLNIKGPIRSYVVQYQAEERNIKRTAMPDGTAAFKMSFIAILYNSDGQIVNSAVNTTQGNLTREQVEGIKAHGLLFRQQISVPETGDYSLRILVHDDLGNRVGAVELPIRAVRNLPAVTIPKT